MCYHQANPGFFLLTAVQNSYFQWRVDPITYPCHIRSYQHNIYTSCISTAFLLCFASYWSCAALKDNVFCFRRVVGFSLSFTKASAFVHFIWIECDLPRRAWKISYTFLFSLAEHCIAPQKPFVFANSSRYFFVWWSSGDSGLIRSDLFWTRRQGMLESPPVSAFSCMTPFHLIVSSRVLVSSEEHTMTQPKWPISYPGRHEGTFWRLNWSVPVLQYPKVVVWLVCRRHWIWAWWKNRIR